MKAPLTEQIDSVHADSAGPGEPLSLIYLNNGQLLVIDSEILGLYDSPDAWENSEEPLQVMDITTKLYMTWWNEKVYIGKDLMQLKPFHFFSECNGYTADTRIAVRDLKVGETYMTHFDEPNSHIITRVR